MTINLVIYSQERSLNIGILARVLCAILHTLSLISNCKEKITMSKTIENRTVCDDRSYLENIPLYRDILVIMHTAM